MSFILSYDLTEDADYTEAHEVLAGLGWIRFVPTTDGKNTALPFTTAYHPDRTGTPQAWQLAVVKALRAKGHVVTRIVVVESAGLNVHGPKS